MIDVEYMDDPSVNKIKLDAYALELRLAGKKYREIGEALGVSYERARQRVASGRRTAGTIERHNNATIMGNLMVSTRLRNGIINFNADDMTFNMFLKNTSLEQFRKMPNLGEVTCMELIYMLHQKKLPKDKIRAWVNRKEKRKLDARIPTIPEVKYETCQKYVIDKDRMFMGHLCNQPLTSTQRKYCAVHKILWRGLNNGH